MPWWLMMPPVIGLIIVCWPIGQWHQWSFFFIGVLIWTLISEAASAWFSPNKKTISNVMRDYRKDHPWQFWITMTCWLMFSWLLIVHLAT